MNKWYVLGTALDTGGAFFSTLGASPPEAYYLTEGGVGVGVNTIIILMSG